MIHAIDKLIKLLKNGTEKTIAFKEKEKTIEWSEIYIISFKFHKLVKER